MRAPLNLSAEAANQAASCIPLQPADDVATLPDFNVMAVNVLARDLQRSGTITCLELMATDNVIVVIEHVGPVIGHGGLPSVQRSPIVGAGRELMSRKL